MKCDHEHPHEKPMLVVCSHSAINKAVPSVTCSTCRFNTVPKDQRQIRGAGDLLARGLSVVGITQERVSRISQAVFGADCKCQERQAAMNGLLPIDRE